ncbi:hypothetical protein N7468_008199 [Penicillium chermesinum]|uniref:FAD/NAD(P)-binding domain-containing protein n=1 Tax=Penicillium chermesinum TaxID=63820 RepID=A0A9W9NPB4_9EURO|nr:uncharacterized protein N7468_008199 [Penicillium chermesinum]KAJ5223657.1 hypothetical protein N7468_008199 [Penicillium chermesinum]
MVRFTALLARSCLVALPLATALTVPQQVLGEQVGSTDLVNEEAFLNASEISTVAIGTSDTRSCENFDPQQWDYDVVIVGGGPAGLAASMSLGRVGRTSLMYDSGQYRNIQTRYMHDVLGQDGEIPLKFRIAVRGQIDMYYSEYAKRATSGVKVTAVQPLAKGFRVYDEQGGKITARKVILATGITDVLPDKPGFKEAFGRGLFWCPWCDGFDYRNRAMVILGTPDKLASAIGAALNMRKLTKDIQIIVGGKPTEEAKKEAEERWPGWENVIKKTYNIKIHEVDVTKIERTASGNEPKDDQYKLTLTGWPSTINTNGILISARTEQTSNLYKQLHLQMAGKSIKVQDNMETSVGGIYAVGDANSDGSTNAYHAMWSAKRAVVNAHVAISKDEYLEAVGPTMVAEEGGDLRFYERQIEELEWMMGHDVEELYKALGG